MERDNTEENEMVQLQLIRVQGRLLYFDVLMNDGTYVVRTNRELREANPLLLIEFYERRIVIQ